MAVMIMAAMTPAVTLVVETTTAAMTPVVETTTAAMTPVEMRPAAMTPVEMRPAATMDSAMIQQQIPEQVLKNSNRELL